MLDGNRSLSAASRAAWLLVRALSVFVILSTMLVGREQGLAGRARDLGRLRHAGSNQPHTVTVTVSQEPLQRLLSSIPR